MHTRRKMRDRPGTDVSLSKAVSKRADHFDRVGVVESLFSESLGREECLHLRLLFCISRKLILYRIHPTTAVVGKTKSQSQITHVLPRLAVSSNSSLYFGYYQQPSTLPCRPFQVIFFFFCLPERRNARKSFTLFFSFVTSLENRSDTKCLRTIYTAPIVFSLLFCLLGCWKFGQVHFLLRVPVFLSKSRCASSTISRPAVDFLAALCFHNHSIRNYRFSPLFSFFIFLLLFCVFILPNIFTGSILEHWSLYNSNISR